MSEKVYSIDEENFNHDFGEMLEALNSNGELEVGRKYWSGIAKKPKPSDFFDVDYDVIENLAERAYNEHGDYADSFPDLSKEDKLELSEIISNWLDSKLKVTFYGVTDVQEHIITQEDVYSNIVLTDC